MSGHRSWGSFASARDTATSNHGGSPVDGKSKFEQGFGTGLAGEPNGMPTREGIRDLGQQTDLVKK